MLHHLTQMYISQYPPLDVGNSFCLEVKMLDSGPKCLRLSPNAKELLEGTMHNSCSHEKHISIILGDKLPCVVSTEYNIMFLQFMAPQEPSKRFQNERFSL
ncbi:hypothetical protein AVEN_165342-1 [Araneus ventricosus]|uniref:Uncharacterized protein n=1 Tax=Araneus ventricosus TaxID=182803 RepID=A0A4Y2AVC0_ARAVE|nr:hypothetical protein AVEN_165342-1 [Araneus ventricosus]